MSPYRVAITGGIGSGKSTIASLFSDLGVPVIDTDIIAREIIEPGKPLLKIITEEFGPEIILPNGELDRHKLRGIIFNNSALKIKLENILHPVIYEEIDNKTALIDYPYCLIVIPLLFETKKQDCFDRVLVIDVPEHIQISRTAERDKTSRELIKKIIANQIKREDRLNYADDIIDNTLEIDELKTIINNLHSRYLCLNKKI